MQYLTQLRDVAEALAVRFRRSENLETDLSGLGRSLGIDRVELKALENDALSVRRTDGGYTVFLANRLSRAERRFVFAHEVSHVLVNRESDYDHRHRNRFSPHQDFETGRLEEFCDEVAHILLMPTSEAQALLEQTDWSSVNVRLLAKSFGVDIEVAASRFIELCGVPTAMVRWEESVGGSIKQNPEVACNTYLGRKLVRLLEPPIPTIPGPMNGRYLREVGVASSYSKVAVADSNDQSREPTCVGPVKVESISIGEKSDGSLMGMSFVFFRDVKAKGSYSHSS